jgi:hypothetical protein
MPKDNSEVNSQKERRHDNSNGSKGKTGNKEK